MSTVRCRAHLAAGPPGPAVLLVLPLAGAPPHQPLLPLLPSQPQHRLELLGLRLFTSQISPLSLSGWPLLGLIGGSIDLGLDKKAESVRTEQKFVVHKV